MTYDTVGETSRQLINKNEARNQIHRTSVTLFLSPSQSVTMKTKEIKYFITSLLFSIEHTLEKCSVLKVFNSHAPFSMIFSLYV